mgnify:CR=1 FL=1
MHEGGPQSPLVDMTDEQWQAVLDVTLNGATAALTGGAHPITAEYSGDAHFAGGVSSTLAQTVTVAGATQHRFSHGSPVTAVVTV